MKGKLTLGEDAGGMRHFLDGLPVHCGQSLELLLPGGAWLGVRYERDGGEVRLYFQLGSPDEKETLRQAWIMANEDCFLRWPEG